MEPIILNLETATDVCSVCISLGERVLALQEITGNQHAAQITLLISACLKQAGIRMNDLGAVAISDGPGSYTSLRVGAATAKGICYALEIPMIAVDTLSSLAYTALQRANNEKEIAIELICSMIDARRMEVYTTLFQISEGALRELIPLRSLIIETGSFDEYFSAGRPIIFCGPGAEKCRETLCSPLAQFDPFPCSASFLTPYSAEAYRQKKFADLAYHTPHYFKEPNITTPRIYSTS